MDDQINNQPLAENFEDNDTSKANPHAGRRPDLSRDAAYLLLQAVSHPAPQKQGERFPKGTIAPGVFQQFLEKIKEGDLKTIEHELSFGDWTNLEQLVKAKNWAVRRKQIDISHVLGEYITRLRLHNKNVAKMGADAPRWEAKPANIPYYQQPGYEADEEHATEEQVLSDMKALLKGGTLSGRLGSEKNPAQIYFGVNPNALNGEILVAACSTGSIERVKMLLEAGADPNWPRKIKGIDRTGEALVVACEAGYAQIVEMLLTNKRPADPRKGEERCGRLMAATLPIRSELTCPLLAAVSSGKSQVVNLLFEKSKSKPDIHIASDLALVWAVNMQNFEMVETLFKWKADPHARENKIFMNVVEQGQFRLFKAFIKMMNLKKSDPLLHEIFALALNKVDNLVRPGCAHIMEYMLSKGFKPKDDPTFGTDVVHRAYSTRNPFLMAYAKKNFPGEMDKYMDGKYRPSTKPASAEEQKEATEMRGFRDWIQAEALSFKQGEDGRRKLGVIKPSQERTVTPDTKPLAKSMVINGDWLIQSVGPQGHDTIRDRPFEGKADEEIEAMLQKRDERGHRVINPTALNNGALITAIRNVRVSTVKLLAKYINEYPAAPKNVFDLPNGIPIITAAQIESGRAEEAQEIIKCLLENGAKPRIRALDAAVFRLNFLGTVELIKAGANPMRIANTGALVHMFKEVAKVKPQILFDLIEDVKRHHPEYADQFIDLLKFHEIPTSPNAPTKKKK